MTVQFNLPQTTSTQPPPFTTADQCGEWLEDQPLGQQVQMQAVLLKGLNQLNRYTLPPGERLAILELLRAHVHEAQEDNARRFAGKPLPLGPAEQAAFDTGMAIWNALVTGYLHCLAACLAGAPGTKPLWPLAAQRALAAMVCLQTDTCRAGRQPAPGYWRTLHQAYLAAEDAGVANAEVADALRLGKNPASPLATWAEGLLLFAASPYEMPQRQFGWVARWAGRWSGKLAVYANPPTLSSRAIPLSVDLDSDSPARYKPTFTPTSRFLDTSSLRESLKKRVALLQQGAAPKDLQLGDDCTQPLCQELLIQAYYHWCKGGAQRKHERRPADGSCTIIGGYDAIYYYVAGRKPFKQPGGGPLSDNELRLQREEIATFGRVIDTIQPDDFSRQQGFNVEEWKIMEEWRILDQSSGGVRLLRPIARAGSRFGGGQLVAVRPKDARALLLGTLRWAMIDSSEALQAGVQIIAGQPQPVALRGTGAEAAREKYSPGFLLPAVAALQEVPSVVMPVGWFRRGRVIEVMADKQPSQLRLTGIIDRGNDFERASYEKA